MTPVPFRTAALGAALFGLIGAAIGRSTVKPRVETIEKTKTVEKLVVDTEATQEVASLRIQLEVAQRNVRTERVVVERPGGIRTIHEVIQSQENVRRSEQAKVETKTVEVVRVQKEVVTARVVETKLQRADWRVAVMGGVDAPAALRLEVKPLVGALVERRILGPFSVGIWGLSSGVGGVAVGVEF